MPFFVMLLFLFSFSGDPDHREHRPPNVVLIFMDDLGYGDLSCYGALDIETPNIDRLARHGVRLTNFLSSQAVCSASRASLLTGCYANRIGISGALFPGASTALAKEEITIAEMLKANGYTTGIFGKWHLGDVPEFLPLSHGFDEYLGIPYSNDMWPIDYDGVPVKKGHFKAWYPPLPLIEGNRTIDTIADLNDQAMLTTRLTDAAIDFIQRNKKNPFFAYIPHPMPHVPINASPEFRGKSRQGLYGDVIQELDHHIGRVLETLRKEGLEKNTIVILTSDNGPWFNYGNHAGSSGGFREGKGTSFEGGHRVPCIVRWPEHVPEGMVANQLSSTLDILPTLASICQAQLPEKKIDGVDISAIIKGNRDAHPRSTFLYYYRTNALEAVRRDNWKLVLEHRGRSYVGQTPGKDGYPGKAPENVFFYTALYDLRCDPSEVHDVKSVYPEIVQELVQLAEAAREDLGDELTHRIGKHVRPSGKKSN